MKNDEHNDHRIETLFVVLTHVTMLILQLLLIVFFVPFFGELYSSGGHLPHPTMFVLEASSFCRIWGLFLILGIGIFAVLDAKLFSYLKRENMEITAAVFTFGFILCSSTIQLLVFWATVLPLIRMGDIVRP